MKQLDILDDLFSNLDFGSFQMNLFRKLIQSVLQSEYEILSRIRVENGGNSVHCVQDHRRKCRRRRFDESTVQHLERRNNPQSSRSTLEN